MTDPESMIADPGMEAADASIHSQKKRPGFIAEGTPGNDNMRGGGGGDIIYGGAGDDIIKGRTGNDRLIGGPGNDRLSGQVGADWLFGGHGDDRLDRGSRLFGGRGDDLMRGSDYITDGPGHDVMIGGLGTEFIFVVDGERDRMRNFQPGEGKINLTAFDQLDISDILANATEKYVNRWLGNTVILDLGGGDEIVINNTFLSDLSTDDFILSPPPEAASIHDSKARPGSIIDGTPGDDLNLRGGGGGDIINGGAGNDRIKGGIGNDRLIGGPGNDFVRGNIGADWLFGGQGDDKLIQGSRLFGGRGDDRLRAEGPENYLTDGPGHDVMIGGGQDEFILVVDGERDRISNFEPGKDKINLEDFGFADYAQVIADAAEVTLGRYMGETVILDLGGGDELVLNGLTLSDLTADDFIL